MLFINNNTWRGGDRLPKDVRGTPQEGPKRFRCGILAKQSQECIKRLSRQEKGKSCKVSLQAHFSAFPGIALQRRRRPRLGLGTTEGEEGEGGPAVLSGPRGSEGAGFPDGRVGRDLAPQPGGEGPYTSRGLGSRSPTHLPCSSSPPCSAPIDSASCPGRSQVLCTRAVRGQQATAPGPQSGSHPAGPSLPLHRLHEPPLLPPPWPCLPPPGREWRPGAGALPVLCPAGGRSLRLSTWRRSPPHRPPRGRCLRWGGVLKGRAGVLGGGALVGQSPGGAGWGGAWSRAYFAGQGSSFQTAETTSETCYSHFLIV